MCATHEEDYLLKKLINLSKVRDQNWIDGV